MDMRDFNGKKLHLAAEGLSASKESIRIAEKELDTLSMGNEAGEEEPDGEGIDPTRFMTRREAAEWGRLSQRKKERHIKSGMKEAERSLRTRNRGGAGNSPPRNPSQEMNGQGTGQPPMPCQRAGHPDRQRGGGKGGTPQQQDWTDRNPPSGKSAQAQPQPHTNTGGGLLKTAETGGQKAAGAGQQILAETGGTQAAKAAATAATQAGTAAATCGATLAVQAGKKAADSFRVSLEAHSMAANQAMQQAQQKMQDVKAANQDMGTLPSAAKYVGATVAAGVLTVAALMLQLALTVFTVLMTALVFLAVTMLAAIVIVGLLAALIIAIVSSVTDTASGGAGDIIQVALAEEGTTDGSKYWDFTMGSQFIDGSATPWCACFVSWCANECGFIDEGIFPNSASVATYRRFYREKGQLHEEEGYVPKEGDLILFGSDEHIGIVQYVEGGRVVTIEGNTSDAVHSRSYALGSAYITGYCSPEYPAGTEIAIPDGMGIFHTYMGWQTVTSPTSLQYQLREASGEHYDEEGFARIGDRYVIACTTTFGAVGDYVDFYREDGTAIHAVIGDIKNQDDPGCNQYGHADGQCVVEYVVQQSSWYPTHANPGTPGCRPEWNSRIVRAARLGRNYFD